MKFLFPAIALILLVEANAFSAQKQPSGKTAASTASSRKDFLQLTSATAFASIFGAAVAPQVCAAIDVGGKIRFGGEEIMVQKEHGTSAKPVQGDLLYNADNKLADKICNYNR